MTGPTTNDPRQKRFFALTFVGILGAGGICGVVGCGDDTAGNVDTDGSDAGDGDVDQPPQFAGPVQIDALSETKISVGWVDGMDDITPAEELTYNVYVADDPAGFDFSAPRGSTGPGIKTIEIGSLTPGQTAYVIVRAVDELGQESQNSDAVSETTIDATPPEFDGIETLTPIVGKALRATWNDASDTGTPAGEMVYQIFLATASGQQDFNTPYMTTAPGAITADITGLDEYTDYFVSVRAVDKSGNPEINFVERSAKTFDETPPDFQGATAATAAGSAIQVQWTAATDNVDDALDLKYNIYANVDTTPGTTAPVATTIPGALSYSLTNLPLNTNYKIIVRAEDTSGNEDDNVVEVSASTGATADQTPPTFNGIVLLQPTGPTSLYAAWDPASDDTTAEGNIVYDVYLATSDGGQNFMTPTVTTAPGVTNADLTGLLPDTQYFAVVRARDISGNQDSNMVQAITLTDPDATAPTFAGLDTALATSPTTIQLDWTDATDNVSSSANIFYYVYAGPDSGSVDFANAVHVTTGGQTSWTQTGLEPQTPMCFAVRAEDEYGNVDTNMKVECATSEADVTPPTFVGIDAVITLDPLRARVNWTNATDDVDPHAEITYLVYWAKGAIDYNSPAAVVGPGANTIVLTGLPPNTKVNFAVRARDEAGNVDKNTKTILDTMPADVTAPTFKGAKNISATSTSVEVFWDQATDYVTPHASMKYEVCGGECTDVDTNCKVGVALTNDCDWYIANGGNKYDFTNVTVTGAVSKLVSGQNPNQKMFYQVRAVDEAGNASVWGPWVSATTLSDITPPTFAGLSTATVAGATQINLTWAAATDPETSASNMVYDIYWNTADSFNFTSPSATTAAGATSYSITGLDPLTQYWIVVKARDQAGNRSSNTASTSRTTAADTTNPDPVSLSSVTGGQCNAISVSWAAGTDDATAHAQMDYQICASTSSTGCNSANFASNIKKTVTGVTSTSITVTNGDGTWYVRVRARDEANNIGTESNQLSGFVNDSIAPYWPGGASLSSSTVVPTSNLTGRVQLNWTQALDACMASNTIQYEVCWSTNSTTCANSFTANVTTSAESYLVTGLSTDTTYYFRVRPKDTEGNTQTSTRSSTRKTHTSYANDIYPSIYNAASTSGGCSGCHAWTRTNTYNVTSGNGACSNTKYVVSGSASTSIIYGKMVGTDLCGGSQMPAGGPFYGSLQTMMANWINQGAYNN